MRRYAPKAKLYLHQPWAYEEDSSRLLDVAKYDSAERMLGDVVRVNSEIADLIGADGVIRSGELFGALQKKGIKGTYRDTYHASFGVGRYVLGLLWYRTITGNPVLENRFCDFDEPISAGEIQLIQEAVDCLD